MTPDWFLKGVYSSMEDFDLVVEEPLIARALYNNHELLLDQINKQVASYIPTVVESQIETFNNTVQNPIPTQQNNPYQIFTALGSCRWLALAGLFIFDYKG